MSSNDPQPSQLPRSSTIITTSTGVSYDVDAHLHCSCPACHHYHHAHKVRVHINRRKSLHYDAECEKCNRKLFSFGGIKRRLTLASLETLPPITDDRSNSVCVSGAQIQSSRPPEASSSHTDQREHAPTSSGSAEGPSASASGDPDAISLESPSQHEDGASMPQTASEPSSTTGHEEVAPQVEVPVIPSVSPSKRGQHSGAKSAKGKFRNLPARLYGKIKGYFKRAPARFNRRSPAAAPTSSTPSGQVEHNKPATTTDEQHDTTPPPIADHISLVDQNRENDIDDTPLSGTRHDDRSIFSSSHMPDGDSIAEQHVAVENPEGDGSVDDAELLRQFNARRRAFTESARSRSQVIACRCDESCTCREDGRCPSASIRVSAPSTNMPTTTGRSSSEPDIFRTLRQDQNFQTDYVGQWMADQQTQRAHDNLVMREATRDIIERLPGQPRSNAVDPRRHSTAPTECSGTTAFISHDDLELPNPPPAPTPPLRTEFTHPPRSLTQSSNLSSRSLPRLATHNLNLQPPLETLGERSSASEHSQEQQRAFTDSAIQTESELQQMPLQTETLHNVNITNNPWRDNHVFFQLPNGHEPTTPPRNSNDHDDSGISVGLSSATRPSPASSLPHAHTY